MTPKPIYSCLTFGLSLFYLSAAPVPSNPIVSRGKPVRATQLLNGAFSGAATPPPPRTSPGRRGGGPHDDHERGREGGRVGPCRPDLVLSSSA